MNGRVPDNTKDASRAQPPAHNAWYQTKSSVWPWTNPSAAEVTVIAKAVNSPAVMIFVRDRIS